MMRLVLQRSFRRTRQSFSVAVALPASTATWPSTAVSRPSPAQRRPPPHFRSRQPRPGPGRRALLAETFPPTSATPEPGSGAGPCSRTPALSPATTPPATTPPAPPPTGQDRVPSPPLPPPRTRRSPPRSATAATRTRLETIRGGAVVAAVLSAGGVSRLTRVSLPWAGGGTATWHPFHEQRSRRSRSGSGRSTCGRRGRSGRCRRTASGWLSP